jgi:TolB-like protein
MSEPADASLGSAELPPPEGDQGTKKKQKNKDKERIRAAWISFVSRILAQLIGAAATVFLGLLVLQKYQGSHENAADPREVATSGIEQTALRARSGGETAIAVLPLHNLSGGPNGEAFAEALTEGLINGLSQMEGLHVISRTSSMQYGSQHKPLRDIAEDLGVDLIVDGSVARAGDRVRVTAQLVDGRTDENIWARSYDRQIGRDVLSVQAELAGLIAREVSGAVASKHPPSDR